MSGGARNNFDGQQWREKVIRTRVNAALADLPPLERRLRYDEEYKRQTAIYEQERDEKKRARQAARIWLLRIVLIPEPIRSLRISRVER